MLFAPFRFARAQLSSRMPCFSRLCCRLLGRNQSESVPSTPPQSINNNDAGDTREAQKPSNHFPPTEQQIEDAIQHFIDSISTDAVRNLASRYNRGKDCKIVNKDNGSFNVCFFVHFDTEDEACIVRIPIVPVISEAWEKLLSEVATMRYVSDKTRIPIPRVIAYGTSDALVDGIETPFIIMNLVSGRQLHAQTFLRATKPQREQLYSDLIDILAQLRMLEFSTGGLLLPNANDEPILGPFLSMTANEFERNSGTHLKPQAFASVMGFVDYHCGILTENCKLPVERQSIRDARMELFALVNMLKEIREYMDSVPLNLPFVLAHPDLRFGNIFIDDDFNIVGIIDWQFASTIPLQLFAPPPWITGNDPDTQHAMRGLLHGPFCGEILAEFHQVLQKSCNRSSGSARLWQEWKFQEEATGQEKSLLQDLAPIAQILRHPSDLMAVYYSSVFRRTFGPTANRDAEIGKFLDHPDNGSLAEQVALQVEKSKCYTQDLENKGLLVEDVQSRQIQEYLAKTEHLV